MRISDWSSDVCSSDLRTARPECRRLIGRHVTGVTEALAGSGTVEPDFPICEADRLEQVQGRDPDALHGLDRLLERQPNRALPGKVVNLVRPDLVQRRSEEHTSELQSLMRISYAVFCLKKKNTKNKNNGNMNTHADNHH